MCLFCFPLSLAAAFFNAAATLTFRSKLYLYILGIEWAYTHKLGLFRNRNLSLTNLVVCVHSEWWTNTYNFCWISSIRCWLCLCNGDCCCCCWYCRWGLLLLLLLLFLLLQKHFKSYPVKWASKQFGIIQTCFCISFNRNIPNPSVTFVLKHTPYVIESTRAHKHTHTHHLINHH